MHMTGNTTGTPPAHALRSRAPGSRAPGLRTPGLRAPGPRELAVAMATVLSMSFLSSQTTSLGVSQNIQGHAQARSVAESALVVAINYVQSDADWRTDKSEGQWVTSASFNGGTFDLYAYDGLDTDGDGVVDDTDGDLADDAEDPVTLKAVGYFQGVSHTVYAAVVPGGNDASHTVLLIVDDDASLEARESQRRDLMEAWGWAVVLLSDNSTQSEYDAALAEVDSVLVPNTVSAGAVGIKLNSAVVGVVIEEGNLSDDLKMSSSSGTAAGFSINVTDDSHYIMETFGSGLLQIATTSGTLEHPNGSLASGAQTLASLPSSATPAVIALETGAALYNGGIAAGRRVAIPTGEFSVSEMTEDAKTLLKRSLDWTGGGDTDNFLSGQWALDEAGGLTAYDSSGNGQDGPITAGDPSTQWTAGKVWGGLRFDGSGTGFIRIPDSDVLDLSTEGTLSAWIYLEGYKNFMGIIHKGEFRDWSDEAYSLQFWTGRRLALTFTTATGSKKLYGNQQLQNGQWYHVVGTWGPNGMALYVNGTLDASNSVAAVGVPSIGSVQIGSQLSENYNSSYKNLPFIGVIDDARIYRRTLTASEIKNQYDQVIDSSDSPQLIALYEFQEVVPPAPALAGHWQLNDMAGGGGTSYDFASGDQGSDVWAYDGQSSSNPPSNNTTPSSELSNGEYNDIEVDDSDSHSVGTSSNNRRPMMRYVFQIDEAEDAVSQIDVTWIGRNYNEHAPRTDGVELYIWNYTSGDYEQLDVSGDTESEVTLSGTINANLSDYIGGGSDDTVTILAQSRDKQTGNRDNILYCDTVSLVINDFVAATDDSVGNDGIGVGGVTAGTAGNGDGGTAFHFDGVDEYVVIPDSGDYLLNDGAVSFWFKPDVLSGHQGLFSKDSQDYDTGGHLHVYTEGSVLKARIQSTNADYTVESTGLSVGSWYHVVVSFGADGLKLYRNGTLVDSDDYTGGIGSNSGGIGNHEPIVFGANTWLSGDESATPVQDFFKGSIDEVRVYDRGLDETQAMDVYNGDAPDSGPATVVYDTSGMGAPLNLNIQDPLNVTWLPSGGLTIDAGTLIVSPTAATKLYNTTTLTDQMSVEIQFTPTDVGQSGPARILSYSGNASSRNFTFGQETDTYVTRLRTSDTTSNGTPDISSPDVLTPGTRQHVILSYDGAYVNLYRDGVLEVSEERTGEFNWDNTFRLMLGDEFTGGYEWLGTLHRVSIYDRAFNASQAQNVFNGVPPGTGSGTGEGSTNWIEP